ncbi:hypothetical protein CUMW_255180, partial [Citrus unshiu]
MAKSMSLHILLVLIFLILFFSSSLAIPVVTYNVISLGAKSDGRSGSTKAFLAAWAKACGSTAASTIYVPPGRYLLHNVVFQGQCRNNDITIHAGNWILFEHVNGVYIYGGILDGQGAGLWPCKRSGNNNCPSGATTLGFSNSNNILINGLTSQNSQMFHVVINGCHNVKVQGVRVSASGNSPNTDGIHVQLSSDVTILNARIGTGDDCSWGRPSTGFARNILFQHALMKNVDNPIVIDQNYCPDNKNCPGKSSGVKISDVTYQDIHEASATEIAVKFDCSPKGHPSAYGAGSFSWLLLVNELHILQANSHIGSLGKDLSEAGGQNVAVKTVTFMGTQNGLRIKSWGRPSSGFARNILFQHAVMKNVQNPIFIDQNYCPNNEGCPGKVSGVSDVTYQDIHVPSATEVAVNFDCSSKNPCSRIKLEDARQAY